jgi:precorrin-6B methylase 2
MAIVCPTPMPLSHLTEASRYTEWTKLMLPTLKIWGRLPSVLGSARFPPPNAADSECDALLECLRVAAEWPPDPGSRVLHIGNSLLTAAIALADALPQCTIIHLERDAVMDSQAATEVRRARWKNLEVLSSDLLSANFLPSSMSAIISTGPTGETIERRSVASMLANLLVPGGWMLVYSVGASEHFAVRLCKLIARLGPKSATVLSWLHRAAAVEPCHTIAAAFESGGLLIVRAYELNGSRFVICRKPDP